MLKNISRVFAAIKNQFSLVGIVVLLSAVLGGAALYLADPLPMRVLRNTVFDQYQRWHPREYQPQPVRIVDIDDESLEKLGQWPWPRTRIAELINRLQDAGAASIGFDVIFAEPDRTSPKVMMQLWDVQPGIKEQLEKLPDHDQVMADALGLGGVIVGFSVERGGPAGKMPVQPYRIISAGGSPLPYLHQFSSAVTSLPVLEQKTSGNGALTFIPDSDGVVRRVPLVIRLGDQVVPSLAAESMRVAQQAGNYIIKTSPAEGAGIQEIRIGRVTIPTTPQAEIWVHYSNPVRKRYVPAWEVLAGEVPEQLLKGNIVLIGTSAQGLMDLRLNPRGEIMPGVEAHAQALEQILGGTYLERPAWAGSIEALVIVVGGLVLGLIALSTGAILSASIAAVLLAATGWGSWHAFTEYGLLLDPVTPGLCLLTIFVLSSIIHHLASERKQRWVKEAFSRYVSPNLVSHLVDNPNQLELGGQRKECSFIFTDLAGFTSLMEKIDPGEAVSLLNAYLDQMIAIAFRHEGTLDRIVGDAVAIMFSAPVSQPDHRQRALDCALEMQAFASRYSQDLKARGIPFGDTRIGIHSGEVIVGNFGGSTIFDFRALGDPVNTASRLESVNKHLGTKICISEATLSGCKNAPVRPVGRLVLKGKSVPLMVYEPLSGEGKKSAPDKEYEDAFALMREESPDAIPAFEQLAAKRPTDPLVALHLRRLQAGERGDLIVMTEK